MGSGESACLRKEPGDAQAKTAVIAMKVTVILSRPLGPLRKEEIGNAFILLSWLAGRKTLLGTAVLQNPSLKLVGTGQSARVRRESRAHYARDPSGQLRREIDLVDRAIRDGVIVFQHQIGENVSNGDTNGISSYHSGVRMHGAALRLRTLTLLTGISGILMLLGMDSTADKPCVLRKAEHRLRKKDENCAKAQHKKLIFAGNFHELLPLSQGSRLVNSCLGTGTGSV